MITAIIAARAGSRRVKNKNLAPFGGTNLLVHKIRQLKQVSLLDMIVVSSDSDVMLAMAAQEGVQTHRRRAEYCDEKTKSFGEVVRHICEQVAGEHIVWAQCTSPLVFPGQYEEAIKTYLHILPPYDSLMSVEPFQKYVWDDRGPVNYTRGRAHVPSQQLPRWYFATGVFIARRLKMIEWCHNIGAHPYRYVLPKVSCLDIDDELDLVQARAWYAYAQAQAWAPGARPPSPATGSNL